MKSAPDCAPVRAWRNRVGARRLARTCRAAVLIGGLCAGGAAAQPPSDVWPEHVGTVLELLQAETRRAIESVQPRHATPGTPAAEGTGRPARPAAAVIELAALYGTRDSLTAIVYVDGVRKAYRPGAALPYAGAGSAHEYRLVRIVDTCVVLRKGARGALRTACFQPGASAPRPAVHADGPGLDGPGRDRAGHGAALGAPLPAPMP